MRIGIVLLIVLVLAAPASANDPKLVRLEGNVLHDENGPFLGLGASYFQALRRAKFDPARFESDLAFLASQKINYVRVLSMVGWFEAWEGREIAPVDFKNRKGKSVAAWPDYWPQLGGMIDATYRHGMRVQITIFADAQLMPNEADRIEHMTKLLTLLKGREHKVILIEVANEAWQNGFPGDDGVKQLRAFARFLGERTRIPIAITSNHEDGESGAIALYRGSAADIATWHFSRDTRTVEGGWLPVRDCYWTVNLEGLPPFSSNEPIGPGSSVASENDPARLVMAAAFAWTAGLPMYVFHASAGVFGREPFEKMPGLGQYANLLKILPPDLPGWTPNNGKEAAAPLTAYAGGQPDKWWPEIKDPRDGVVANNGAIKSATGEFVTLPIGVQKEGVRFAARRPLKLQVYTPLTAEIVTNLNLTAGAGFKLPQGPGAYIIRGQDHL